MAQMPAGSTSQRPRGKPANDIYTVLVSIGLVSVLGSIAFIVYRCIELLDSPLPGFLSN